MTESAAIEAALRQYLDRSSDTTMLLRRRDRLGRAQEHTQRDLELLSETFAVWTKRWFAHTPTLAPDAKGAARLTAESRYRQFVEHVTNEPIGTTEQVATVVDTYRARRVIEELFKGAEERVPDREEAARELRGSADRARSLPAHCRAAAGPATRRAHRS